MREIKLVTNCERPPNWLMDIAVHHWLESGFKPENLVFLVNNIFKNQRYKKNKFHKKKYRKTKFYKKN